MISERPNSPRGRNLLDGKAGRSQPRSGTSMYTDPAYCPCRYSGSLGSSSILRRRRVTCTSMERSSATFSCLQSSPRLKGRPACTAKRLSRAASAPVSLTGLPPRASAARWPDRTGRFPSAPARAAGASGGAARRSRIHPQQQFARLERFGQIVVCPCSRPAMRSAGSPRAVSIRIGTLDSVRTLLVSSSPDSPASSRPGSAGRISMLFIRARGLGRARGGGHPVTIGRRNSAAGGPRAAHHHPPPAGADRLVRSCSCQTHGCPCSGGALCDFRVGHAAIHGQKN